MSIQRKRNSVSWEQEHEGGDESSYFLVGSMNESLRAARQNAQQDIENTKIEKVK